MRITNGELYVDGRVYEPPVVPPDIRETIFPLDPVHIQRIKTTKGETHRKGNCCFIGYSAEVKDIGDVRAAYTKVTQLNAQALHVMCAFRLPGADIINLCGYEDNGEHGGVRVMFQILEECEIYHRAIFVVRYFGNRHLGQARFQLIAAAVRTAITASSFNSILQQHQVPWKPKEKLDKTSRTNPGYVAAVSPKPFTQQSWGSRESLVSNPEEQRDIPVSRSLRPRANSVNARPSNNGIR